MKSLSLARVLAFWGTVAMSAGALANPVSAFPITIDGRFTGGVVGGVVQGEWSDFTPQAFIAPPNANGVLQQATTLSDANSLLYAGLAPESVGGPVKSLYLMYVYEALTAQRFPINKVIFDVKFPVVYQGVHHDVDVLLVGTGPSAPSFYRVVVLSDGVVVPDGIVIENGAVAAGFGLSPLASTVPHFQMELEVNLLIDPGFGTPSGPFPQGGLPGVYPAGEASWNASAINNFVDPPISAAVFTIHPDGSTTIDVSAVPQAVPEPSVLYLVGTGLAMLSIRRRRPAVKDRLAAPCASIPAPA